MVAVAARGSPIEEHVLFSPCVHLRKKAIASKKKFCCRFFFVWCLVALQARLLGHIAQIQALMLDWRVKKPYNKRKNLLVVGGTRTQVLAVSMAIAASELNQRAIVKHKKCRLRFMDLTFNKS